MTGIPISALHATIEHDTIAAANGDIRVIRVSTGSPLPLSYILPVVGW